VTLHIDTSTPMFRLVESTMEEMQLKMPLETQESCPHCGIPIRFPLVMHVSDYERLESILQVTNDLAIKYGITETLLSEIRTQCIIEIARRKKPEAVR